MPRQEQLWEAYIESFRAACNKKDREVAEKILNSAFSDAEDYRELDARLIWATHSLASLYCSSELEGQAEALYSRLVELTEKVLGAHHPDAIESLEKVALAQLKNRSDKQNEYSIAV